MSENECPWCEGELPHDSGERFDACPVRDRLSAAFHTGRIHAERGGRCAVDTATELFGERVARAYEDGYRREIARAAAA